MEKFHLKPTIWAGLLRSRNIYTPSVCLARMLGSVYIIPEGYREWSGPEEKRQTVEVPDVELVVERACKHHSHQVGGKQHQEHV